MIDLLGLTNAMTDITVHVMDKELKDLGLKKGFLNRSGHYDMDALEAVIEKKDKKVFQAGSPANVVFGAAHLGLQTGLIASVGDDPVGSIYLDIVVAKGITPYFNKTEGRSGICYIMVTPDGEKTIVARVGLAGQYKFNLKIMDSPKIAHTSGYELLTNPQKTIEFIHRNEEKGAKISFDLADPSVVRSKRMEIVYGILHSLDVVFVTEEELSALDEINPDMKRTTLDDLIKQVPIVVLKKGKKGSVVFHKTQSYKIPIYPVEVVNTNGAGDAYAAGFLCGLHKKLPVEECGHFASKYAASVCEIEGSHF
jgi:sugar/nucleoside kinase (ribokinase family)